MPRISALSAPFIKVIRINIGIVEIIKAEAGKQFDPQLVEIFLSIHEQFREISKKFAEPYAEFVSPTQAADEDFIPLNTDKLTREQELLLTQTMEQANSALASASTGASDAATEAVTDSL